MLCLDQAWNVMGCNIFCSAGLVKAVDKVRTICVGRQFIYNQAHHYNVKRPQLEE